MNSVSLRALMTVLVCLSSLPCRMFLCWCLFLFGEIPPLCPACFSQRFALPVRYRVAKGPALAEYKRWSRAEFDRRSGGQNRSRVKILGGWGARWHVACAAFDLNTQATPFWQTAIVREIPDYTSLSFFQTASHKSKDFFCFAQRFPPTSDWFCFLPRTSCTPSPSTLFCFSPRFLLSFNWVSFVSRTSSRPSPASLFWFAPRLPLPSDWLPFVRIASSSPSPVGCVFVCAAVSLFSALLFWFRALVPGLLQRVCFGLRHGFLCLPADFLLFESLVPGLLQSAVFLCAPRCLCFLRDFFGSAH